MKKFISALIVFVMLVTSLVSCGLFGDKGGEVKPKYDGTVYSGSVSVKLVRGEGSPDYVGAGYIEVYQKLKELGVDAVRESDTRQQSSSEIVLGETNREASISAKSIADGKHVQGNITFAIVYKEGALAVYGVDERSFSEAVDYLILNYLTSVELKVATDHSYSVSMTEAEYEAYLAEKESAELLANWDSRFDYLKEYTSDEAVNALKQMYKLFDEDVYLWVANLWDDETGAFYYACSSRDYEGFLPDIESTTQALKIVAGSGMIDNWGGGLEALDAAIPEEMQEKVLNFIFSLYCDDDGYFYHKQWGQNINDDRKGRDLTWSMQLVNHFKASLPEGWVDAVTRLKNQGTSTASAVSSVLESYARPTASDNRFASKENFKAYLDSLNLLADSYGKGHQLASQADQIGAAGLLDYCCDYLDALQEQVYNEQLDRGETPTGLWEDTADYHGISGFFKLNVVYSAAKRAPKYLDYALDSCVKCILSDEMPTQVVYVYNPWAAIGECVSRMRLTNTQQKTTVYDVDAVYERLWAQAEEMFDKTTEKAEGFRKTDGGYSYYLEHSASSIQGVYASRGYAEGDLNATCLLVYHMIGYMEGAFGVQLPPIWNITDYRRFLNEIDNLEPIEKKAGVSEINCDFERYSVDDTPQNDGIVADNGTGSCKIEADPDDSTNNVLALNSPANSATGYKIRPNFIKTKNCFVFEADLNIPEKSSGTTHQISLYTGSERYYMLTLGGNEDSISIGDASNVTSTVTPEGKVNPISQSFGASVPTGEWFKLKLEVYETTDDGFRVKIFLNNEYIYTSNNYFEKELGTEPLLSGAVTMVWVYNLIKPSATLLADNIKMYYTDTEYVDGGGSSSDSEAYDFESSNVKVGSNLHSTGAKAELTTAENIDGDDSGVYHLSKTNTDGWDQLSFKMPSAIDEGSVVRISMDIKFNNFSGGGAQLAFGALDADAYYMLGMTSSGTNISIYDSSTMKSGVTATKNNYSKTMTLGKWHTLLVELYVTENSRNFSATIYLDGVRVATSTNYYNYDGATDVPNISLDFIHLRFVKATSVDVYLDNVVIECE